MPHWFAERPEHVFLTFREVCDLLPVDAVKYLVRGNRLFHLEPHVQLGSRSDDLGTCPNELWMLDGTQRLYEFQTSLRLCLANVRDVDLALLHEHSQIVVNSEPVTLWWRQQDVENFRDAWQPIPYLAEGTDPLPWETATKRGRKRARWRVALEEATARQGAPLTKEAALRAIEAAGVTVEKVSSGYVFDGVHVGDDTFRNALAKAWKAVKGASK